MYSLTPLESSTKNPEKFSQNVACNTLLAEEILMHQVSKTTWLHSLEELVSGKKYLTDQNILHHFYGNKFTGINSECHTIP